MRFSRRSQVIRWYSNRTVTHTRMMRFWSRYRGEVLPTHLYFFPFRRSLVPFLDSVTRTAHCAIFFCFRVTGATSRPHNIIGNTRNFRLLTMHKEENSRIARRRRTIGDVAARLFGSRPLFHDVRAPGAMSMCTSSVDVVEVATHPEHNVSHTQSARSGCGYWLFFYCGTFEAATTT